MTVADVLTIWAEAMDMTPGFKPLTIKSIINIQVFYYTALKNSSKLILVEMVTLYSVMHMLIYSVIISRHTNPVN